MAKSLKSAVINAAFGIPEVMDQYGDDPYLKEMNTNTAKIMNLFKKPRMAMAGMALATCAALDQDPDLADYIYAAATLTLLETAIARPLLNSRQKAGEYYIDTDPDTTTPAPPSNKVYTQLKEDGRDGGQAAGLGALMWGGASLALGPDVTLITLAAYSIVAYCEPVVKLKMIEDGEWSVSETPPAQPEKQKEWDTGALPQPGPG